MERTSASAAAPDSGLLVLDELLSFMDDVDLEQHAPHLPAHAPPMATPPMMPPPTASLAPAMSPVGDIYHDSTIEFASSTDADAILDALAFPTDSSDDDLSLLSTSLPTVPPSLDPQDGESSLGAPTALKKRRRRRQKEELDYLRVRVKELEDELNRLRGEDIASSAMAVGTARALNLLPPMKKTKPGDDDGRSDSGSAEEPPQQSRDAALALLWERVAQQQKEATQQAVLENIKLRAMVEGQLAVARSLENGLRKRPRFATLDLSPYLGRGSTMHLDPSEEAAIYDQLGHDLDVQYAQVDRVLEACGLAHCAGEVPFDPQVRADENGMYLQHSESRVLPFDLPAVARAVWTTLGRESVPFPRGIYTTREITDDTICAKVVDTLSTPKGDKETVLTIRIVLKRFMEDTRVVTVWESLVEAAGPFNLRLRERAWNVLRPLSLGDIVGRQTCLAQSCIRVTPEMAESSQSKDVEVGTLTNLVVGSYHRNLGIMQQIVERLLREEAEASKSCQ
ncbi:hypothetical protein P43SY_004722 [Pythium insidiosum]|uniref:M96 mating-specific protein family n=1 Tax=Pythium insidiosum TaxID=114742 RepID=A0AAD5LDA4_PYTIN|nr:hypothetical protein P43SY_004722 [Pythium insidiosum]